MSVKFDAWSGLDNLNDINDFVPFLRAFIESGDCGCDHRGDAFYSASNDLVTWMDIFTDKLENAIKKENAKCQ